MSKNLLTKDSLPFDRSVCEICGGQSGGKYVGVACIPGAPMSIAWCDECLQRDVAPAFVFEFDFIHVAGGHLANLAEWARDRETWADGQYISFDEFVKRITPEMVLEALAGEPKEPETNSPNPNSPGPGSPEPKS